MTERYSHLKPAPACYGKTWEHERFPVRLDGLGELKTGKHYRAATATERAAKAAEKRTLTEPRPLGSVWSWFRSGKISISVGENAYPNSAGIGRNS